MSRLSELYLELVQEEGPIELEPFLELIVKGEHGDFSPSEIDDFIDETLGAMIDNIRIKAGEAPHLEAMREDVEAETYPRMKELKEKYGSGRKSSGSNGSNEK